MSTRNMPVETGRRRTNRKEARTSQRTRILQAFVRDVGRLGFDDAHINTVCTAAGVSTRDFYKHFPTKQDCFCAALDQGAAMVFDRAAAAYRASGGPWKTDLRCAVRAVLKTLAENPLLARLCIVEAFYAVPRAREHLDTAVRHFQDEFGGRFLTIPQSVNGTDYRRSVVSSVIGPMADYIREGRTRRLPELEPLIMYRLIP
jgi:AcrR family transcriptional regulator